MKRILGILVVAVITLSVTAFPAAAGDTSDGAGLISWHGNPLTCDEPFGSIPAGMVNLTVPRGTGWTGWATSAEAPAGPSVHVLLVALHFRGYALNADGTGPTDQLLLEFSYELGAKVGLLPTTTCHKVGTDPSMPGVWGILDTEVVVP